ncbi:MAG TPA: GxxExxY protein [Chitinophagaceae bacterium]|jgi:GxxExxY protein|nr:GxxExxY protein [Chitinophagaceae bacterium]
MELLYKEEAYKIVACCIEVWKTLGYGFSEVIYKDAMEEEFLTAQLPYIRENELFVHYKGKKLRHKFRADFTMFENIIVEVKSCDEGLPDAIISQVLNYLRASDSRLGLILNFSKKSLQYKRLIM